MSRLLGCTAGHNVPHWVEPHLEFSP